MADHEVGLEEPKEENLSSSDDSSSDDSISVDDSSSDDSISDDDSSSDDSIWDNFSSDDSISDDISSNDKINSDIENLEPTMKVSTEALADTINKKSDSAGRSLATVTNRKVTLLKITKDSLNVNKLIKKTKRLKFENGELDCEELFKDNGRRKSLEKPELNLEQGNIVLEFKKN